MDGHSARVERNTGSTSDVRGPLILLVEDDPVSRQYLTAALTALAGDVVACADGPSALEAATNTRFNLLVIDRNLPGLDGPSLLRRLRDAGAAASTDSPAVATSAEWTVTQRRHMLEAGFSGTLAKPCSRSELQHMLEEHVDPGALPVRLDETALEAAGGAANLVALRRLFTRELASLEAGLPGLVGNRAALLERLHRLCSSAGFCGAPALAAACRHWLAQLRDNAHSEDGRAGFEQALHEARQHFS